jgi:cytochrome c-type biogenesis protein CcmH/NrfG
MGFVTPTLAEIYAKQGWFDDAIKAYRTLARSKPAEKERYEKRIAELEELKKKSGG